MTISTIVDDGLTAYAAALRPAPYSLHGLPFEALDEIKRTFLGQSGLLPLTLLEYDEDITKRINDLLTELQPTMVLQLEWVVEVLMNAPRTMDALQAAQREWFEVIQDMTISRLDALVWACHFATEEEAITYRSGFIDIFVQTSAHEFLKLDPCLRRELASGMPIPAVEKRRAARENMLAVVKRPGHSRSSSDDSSSSTESPTDGLARFGFGSRLAATSASPTSPPSLPYWKPPVGPQVQFTLPSFAKSSTKPPRFKAETERIDVSVSPLTVVFPPEHMRQPERTRHRPPFLPLKSAMKPPHTTPSPPSVPTGAATPRRIGTTVRRVSVVVHPSLQTSHHTESDLDSPFTGGLPRTSEARTAGPLKVTFCEKDLTKPLIRDRLKPGHSRTHSGFF